MQPKLVGKMKLKLYDCQLCQSKASVVLLKEETDSFKGVMQEHPLYYKYCKVCRREYNDNDVNNLNLLGIKKWIKESND